MEICFEGIGQMVATFATKEELASGMAVTLKESGTVELGKENGSPLCGVTVGAARSGAVAVQIGGVVKVNCPKDDGVPKVGWQQLVCDDQGRVKTTDGADGTNCLVLAADGESVVIKL